MVFDFISWKNQKIIFAHNVAGRSFVHMAVHMFELVDPDLGMNLDLGPGDYCIHRFEKDIQA